MCSQSPGVGVHIADSSSSTAVLNNTAIYHSCQRCQLTLYCYSNSSAAITSAYITTPNNGDQYLYSYYRDPISIDRVSPSGIRLRYQYNYRQSAVSGIYICKIPDSNGNQIHFSVGLYFSQPGRLIFCCYMSLCYWPLYCNPARPSCSI